MKRALLPFVLMTALVAVAGGADWRQFRGTDNSGRSDETNLPKSFDDAQNVAWKIPLPGRGPSSPIVVGDQVLVTCSSGAKQDRMHLMSFDVATGKTRWHRQMWATGQTACHPFGALAGNTPASDGRRVYAFYSSNDLACFDLDGNLQWFRGLARENPSMRNDVGMASSPLVVRDVLIVQCENQGESFIMGLDAVSGKTLWRRPRDQDAIWSSPIVLRGPTPQQDLVLFHGRGKFSAHDPTSGEPVWEYEASCHTTASATTSGNRVYLPANGIHSLRHDPATRTVELLWNQRLLRGGNASPVVSEGRVYVVKPPAILVCGHAETGDVLWQLRLKGPVWATTLVADGHAYVVNHAGLLQVVRLGEQGELVGEYQLDAGILASPAVADGAIYFRSDRHLWKFAKP